MSRLVLLLFSIVLLWRGSVRAGLLGDTLDKSPLAGLDDSLKSQVEQLEKNFSSLWNTVSNLRQNVEHDLHQLHQFQMEVSDKLKTLFGVKLENEPKNMHHMQSEDLKQRNVDDHSYHGHFDEHNHGDYHHGDHHDHHDDHHDHHNHHDDHHGDHHDDHHGDHHDDHHGSHHDDHHGSHHDDHHFEGSHYPSNVHHSRSDESYSDEHHDDHDSSHQHTDHHDDHNSSHQHTDHHDDHDSSHQHTDQHGDHDGSHQHTDHHEDSHHHNDSSHEEHGDDHRGHGEHGDHGSDDSSHHQHGKQDNTTHTSHSHDHGHSQHKNCHSHTTHESHHQEHHVHHHHHRDDHSINSKYDFAICGVMPNKAIPEEKQQNITGMIRLWQKKNGTTLHIHIHVQGFKMDIHQQHDSEDHNQNQHTQHSHGFHVHRDGDLSNGCQSTGPHFNPLETAHGGPKSTVRHVGDLGNIECDQHGVTNVVKIDEIASLHGPHSIIGKSLVIHENFDDFGTNPDIPASISSGNAGSRIACCIIEKVDRLPPPVKKANKSHSHHHHSSHH